MFSLLAVMFGKPSFADMKYLFQNQWRTFLFATLVAACGGRSVVSAQSNLVADVQAEHNAIGNAFGANTPVHTMNPGAQWYPDAGLGLFIHWGIASVRGINISWSMRDGLNGRPAQIAPNDYFALAKDFDPTHYEPDKWIKAAKEAGFVYAVLTTRHHEGFALWASQYGDFSTRNYLSGRDLLQPFVDACRKYNLKVGLYYSPPNWYFDRDFMNFSLRKGAAPLGPELKPRAAKPTLAELAAHRKAYAEMVRGQLEELLTRYGRIDLLWFDGKVPGANSEEVMPLSRIRELQPGIVVNTRFHGKGDFITYERKLSTRNVADGWAEFCNTWTDYWPYVVGAKYRANGFILGQYVTCRALHINYLPDVGPMANGELPVEDYANFAVVGAWMKTNGQSVNGTLPLPQGESSSVPATASGKNRYLFALPIFKGTAAEGSEPGRNYPEDRLPPRDETLTLSGISTPGSVQLLGDGGALDFHFTNKTVTVQLPAARRTPLVDVIKIELKGQPLDEAKLSKDVHP
jgi:alpha-L-fucosidase